MVQIKIAWKYIYELITEMISNFSKTHVFTKLWENPQVILFEQFQWMLKDFLLYSETERAGLLNPKCPKMIFNPNAGVWPEKHLHLSAVHHS